MVRLMQQDQTAVKAPPLISREVAKQQGKTRFFPGLRCYKGHLSERYTSNGMCIQCQNEANAARRAEKHAANGQPEPVRYDLPHPSTWQFVERGRYALEYQGHMLQAITNPDREDSRRYIPVVDKNPLAPAYSLNEAKTKAIRHVINQLGKPKDQRAITVDPGPQPAVQAYPTDAPQPSSPPPDPVQEGPQPQPVVQPEPQPDVSYDQQPAAEPEPRPEPVQAFEQPQPEPAPQPAADQEPAPVYLPALNDPAGDSLTALFTVRVKGHDVVATLSALQAAAEMLRELGHVDCEITLPRTIRL